MDYAAVLEAVNSWGLEDRIRLVEAVSQGIDAEKGPFEMSEKLKQELERRIAEDDANPDEGLPWEVVEAQALARWKRSATEQTALDATLNRRLEEIQSGKEPGVSADEFLDVLGKEFP